MSNDIIPLKQAMDELRFDDALALCEPLLAEGSIYAMAAKGWCLYQQGSQPDGKLICDAFNEAPEDLNVATLMLSYYMATFRYRDVVKACQQCIAFHLNDRLMWHRLATSHYFLGENDSSITAFKHSLAISRTIGSSFGVSLPLISQGHYSKGFRLYEHRFGCYSKLNWLQCEKLPMPRWQGEPIEGKALLIWSEQGLGDSIQFCRFVNELVEQGAEVDLILENSHSRLRELLLTLKGVGQIMAVTNKVVSLNRRYDYHCPMMSLMKETRLTPETIPGKVPYLFAPKSMDLPVAVDAGDMKIGLVWRTALNPGLLKEHAMHYAQKDQKSLSINEIEPLLATAGAHFFVLQLSVSDDEQAILGGYKANSMADSLNSFSDTAAIIEQMDMVISIDTSVVHLAGAMAKPVINMLPLVSDWRWQNNRDDSPWYPTMRLCQQRWDNDWGGVVERVCTMVNKSIERFNKDGVVSIQ